MRQLARQIEATNTSPRSRSPPEHPRLREHLASVIGLMRISADYDEFEAYLNKVHPRWDDNLELFSLD